MYKTRWHHVIIRNIPNLYIKCILLLPNKLIKAFLIGYLGQCTI